MPKPVSVHCQCKQFQAQLQPAHLPLLAWCYCSDCQRYAHFFAQPQHLLDGANPAGETGSVVMVIHPSQLKILTGAVQLRCLQQQPKGAWRWYAACCHTPILNMAPHTQTHHLALLLNAVTPTACQKYLRQPILAVRQQRTPQGSWSQQLQLLWFALRYAYGMCYAKLTRAHVHNPLLNAKTGELISPVHLMDAVTYATLEAKRQAHVVKP